MALSRMESTSTRSGAPIFVNGLNFEHEVLDADRPVLVDVSTRWCGPCRMARPIVEQIAAASVDHLKVVEIDGDDSPDLVAHLMVRGFPTFILFEKGHELRRSAGFGGARALHEFARCESVGRPGT